MVLFLHHAVVHNLTNPVTATPPPPCVPIKCSAIRGWQTVQSHAGYDLPFDPCNRGPFHGGARRHDFHHSHNHGCYGDWTPFWDWACGTDTAYSAHWDKHRSPG